MPSSLSEKLEAIHALPLRKNVRWIDLSYLYPGLISEAEKSPAGTEAEFKFASVNLEDSLIAAEVVKLHNEHLKNHPPKENQTQTQNQKHE